MLGLGDTYCTDDQLDTLATCPAGYVPDYTSTCSCLPGPTVSSTDSSCYERSFDIAESGSSPCSWNCSFSISWGQKVNSFGLGRLFGKRLRSVAGAGRFDALLDPPMNPARLLDHGRRFFRDDFTVPVINSGTDPARKLCGRQTPEDRKLSMDGNRPLRHISWLRCIDQFSTHPVTLFDPVIDTEHETAAHRRNHRHEVKQGARNLSIIDENSGGASFHDLAQILKKAIAAESKRHALDLFRSWPYCHDASIAQGGFYGP